MRKGSRYKHFKLRFIKCKILKVIFVVSPNKIWKKLVLNYYQIE